jgi:D-threo-aldose 1-dehydrogenase
MVEPMRRTALPGTDLTTSVLGYGCGALMARMDRAESVRCLEVAFDSGITHFDAARSYGYGEAESALGSFLAGKRDQVTVTTKLGIAPPRASTGLAAAKAVGRRVLALAPPLRRLARRGAAQLQSEGHFRVDEARASFETSLRELGVDHVDLLLLHECRPEDLDDDLLEFLRGCVAQGKVRHFGLATDPRSTRRILDEAEEYAQVVQLENSVVSPALDVIGEQPDRAVVSHSVLLEALGTVHAHVTATEERARLWSEAVGADCSQRTVLAGLMLADASWAGPATLALYSSRAPEHIRANAEQAESVAAEQVERFADLVAREIRPEPIPG